MVFQPVLKNYIWGGTRIARMFNRPVNMPDCGESWEISDRPEGMSVVLNGRLAGKSLRDIVKLGGQEVTGAACATPNFPLLFKIIDARTNLSVQVHPDDEAAAEGDGEAKSELWYVIDADPGAMVYAGFEHPVTPDAFRRALADKTIASLLHPQPVRAGDAILLPGGIIHAAGAGCLLYEMQQNSNTTYRIYDWDRVDAAGKPRELHIEQAMRVIRWDAQPARPLPTRRLPTLVAGNEHSEINHSLHFHTTRWKLARPQNITLDGRSFEALFVCHGSCVVAASGIEAPLPAGASCLVPASVPSYVMSPGSPDTVVLRTALGS
jgi:mannose-6-phosphate isomerase